jgi:ADP-heptose:LPS heptosyltransferase
LASISQVRSACSEAASELLRQALAGEAWDPRLAGYLVENNCSEALFSILVEGLADRFEPRLCDVYAAIFSLVIERLGAGFQASDLYARYLRVREPKVCRLDPERVVVLSRVTLGADIAVTAVMLDAVSHRFPRAEICLAGSGKAHELFAGLPRIRHFDLTYPRAGDLAGRLASWRQLNGKFPGAIVVDPDSRLTQLGLLPICPEENYFFFESRSYGGDGDESLTTLARRWARETFGIDDARNQISPPATESHFKRPAITVSLGAGDNPAKQLPEVFEADLIRFLCTRFATVLVDRGFGHEEAARIDRITAGTTARTFTGSFARFASLISAGACYLGYDSAGQHAAAAFGTPLLTLFKGFVSERMFARWQPTGNGPKQVLRIEGEVSMDAVRSSLACVFPT